jgi:chitinase
VLAATAAALLVFAVGLARTSFDEPQVSDPTPDTAEKTGSPWFGAYYDLTLDPGHRLADLPGHGQVTTVLSFITAGPTNPCQPSWGGRYDLKQANDELDLDGQIEQYRASGNDIAVSFGGQVGEELSSACTDVVDLTQAYESVITRYGLDAIDLDVEGAALDDVPALKRRADAFARLQTTRETGTPLNIWLTLPVSADGLPAEAEAAVSTMLEAGVELAGVNIMTMNFEPLKAGQSMLETSISAANAAHRQLGALYERAGQHADPARLWQKIGLTPMIGENDVHGQVLDLLDAEGLNSFALERGIGRLSMWSLSRDRTCTPVDRKQVPSGPSPSCSGVKQEEGMFAKLLGNGYIG